MTASRIESAVLAAGGTFQRIDDPAELPPATGVDVLVVDWAARRDDWGARLTAWRPGAGSQAPRIVLFGPHTDLDAHRAAKASGLGPMRARSALFAGLPTLLSEGG
ncbi:MAG TPA: hypothetical protein VIC63_02675 [Candidatus Limnocylindria bacterium]